MDLQQKIKELSAPFLSEIDAFMVDVYLGHADQQDVIQLFVDTDSGITIQQCADLNRKIGEALELQNIIQHFYVLEVSSPDVTKPLKLLRQYRKNIGRRFRVRYRKGDETGEILARLEDVEGENVTFITTSGETCKVSFHEIIETIEELPW